MRANVQLFSDTKGVSFVLHPKIKFAVYDHNKVLLYY